MNMPGFTAEVCLVKTSASYRQRYKTSSSYSQRSGYSDAGIVGRVVPAVRISDDEFYQLCHFFDCGAISYPDGSRGCVC
jgi:hypothetical protein